jgi:hypothetical protein
MRALLNYVSWPPAFVIIVIAVATKLLPARYTALSTEAGVVVAVLLGSVAVVSLVLHVVRPSEAGERRASFALTILLSVFVVTNCLMVLGLVATGGPSLKGGPLLQASVLAYALTILTFSLWYWLLDDGRDFIFPQRESDSFPDWSPIFFDYLFLAWTASTAFSPTDVLPASRRAKLLMMVQGGMSLVLIAVGAARAINVL